MIIHFNVGGQMFEIPYEKFFAYPESLLTSHMGDMVKSKLEKAKDSKEKFYFSIDRDPILFSHIHRYYLTGECHFHENADPVNGHQVTYDELAFEFKYYRFPVDAIPSPKRLQDYQELNTKESDVKKLLTQSTIAQLRGIHINNFIQTLQKIILELILVKCSQFTMVFTHRQNPPTIKFSNQEHSFMNTNVWQKINTMLDPFGSSGAIMLDIYTEFIKEYMRQNIPMLSKWSSDKGFNPDIGQYHAIDLRIATKVSEDNVFFETSMANRTRGE
ncbi:4148_t:CDS:2 [Ambispora gerdemannii]|uniref:4148_t:CDS:1 n=1 Tax=Ambispora gerdemannii TaxID=144530 RepID=A0A9N9HBF0_9GLOM|nr:4148_t:CDS:2 [Ambispora gerdemannii]